MPRPPGLTYISKQKTLARAQRRAMMEPMPSQMRATAKMPYMQMAGASPAVFTGVPVALAEAVSPNNIKGINSPIRPPSRRVRMP